MFDTPDRQSRFARLETEFSGQLSQDNVPPQLAPFIIAALRGGTSGKAKPTPASALAFPEKNSFGLPPLTSHFANAIPGAGQVPCTGLLLGYCFDGDSFDDRLREIVYHASVHCPETAMIVLVTTKWSPETWRRKHEQAFRDLRAMVAIYFYLDTSGTLSRIL